MSMKNSDTIRNRPATFRLVQQCLNHLRNRVRFWSMRWIQMWVGRHKIFSWTPVHFKLRTERCFETFGILVDAASHATGNERRNPAIKTSRPNGTNVFFFFFQSRRYEELCTRQVPPSPWGHSSGRILTFKWHSCWSFLSPNGNL